MMIILKHITIIIEYLDKYQDGLFYNIISDIATEIEYILFETEIFY